MLNLRVLLYCVTLLLLPAPGQGFMPAIESVQSALHKQFASLDSYRVDIVPLEDPTLLIRHWQEGGLWRQEWVSHPDTEQSTLLLAAVGQGRTLNGSFPMYRSIPLPFLSFWHPLSRTWWETYRINTSVMSYQFLDDRPALVIGAEYGQTRIPQLWVDNQRHTPLRLLTPEFDLQWASYHRVGNHWLPKKMIITFPDTDPFSLDIAWRGVNIGLTPDRFSREALFSTYGSRYPLGFFPGPARPLFDRFPQALAQY
jgi:hypothetical protein